MVEHEISRLETQIGQLQTDLHREKETNKEYKFEQLHHAALNNQRGFSSLPSPRSNRSALGASERVPFETKSLHFISKAIKGDYNAIDFSNKEKLMGNLRAMISDHKENSFQKEVGIQQLDEKLVSRKSGMLKPISPSPSREPRHPSPRVRMVHLICTACVHSKAKLILISNELLPMLHVCKPFFFN